MNSDSRIWQVGVAFGAGLCSGVILAWYWGRSPTKQKTKKEEDKVLFFPDVHTSGDPAGGKDNLSKLLQALASAKDSLDVCIFTFSHRDLADTLINTHQRGVVVRVLTDNEQMHSYGCQVERLRRAGIQVRLDTTSYYMHHKFAIIDHRRLVNGSLNWTAQAIQGNQENLIVTSKDKLVQPFVKQFQLLWEKYDPDKLLR